MDQAQLTKFFPITRDTEPDVEQALLDLGKSAREFALTLQSLLPESATKNDLHMRLFHVMRDAELALRLDGPTRTHNMVIVKQ